MYRLLFHRGRLGEGGGGQGGRRTCRGVRAHCHGKRQISHNLNFSHKASEAIVFNVLIMLMLQQEPRFKQYFYLESRIQIPKFKLYIYIYISNTCRYRVPMKQNQTQTEQIHGNSLNFESIPEGMYTRGLSLSVSPVAALESLLLTACRKSTVLPSPSQRFRFWRSPVFFSLFVSRHVFYPGRVIRQCLYYSR